MHNAPRHGRVGALCGVSGPSRWSCMTGKLQTKPIITVAGKIDLTPSTRSSRRVNSSSSELVMLK